MCKVLSSAMDRENPFALPGVVTKEVNRKLNDFKEVVDSYMSGKVISITTDNADNMINAGSHKWPSPSTLRNSGKHIVQNLQSLLGMLVVIW
jgi:hypothetical protein